MTITVIGGLLLSLILTLLVIPCTYSVMDDLSNFLSRKKKETPREQEPF